MPHTHYTKELLVPIVASSKSYSECLQKLGKKSAGGNYKLLQQNIMKFDLSTEHMTHQSWNKNNQIKQYSDLSKPSSIKKRLLQELGHKCQKCGLETWNSEPIPLELEHIDGDNRNHSRDNVTLLCCNCHAQTPTWRNRKRG
jgi:hypothetical protein